MTFEPYLLAAATLLALLAFFPASLATAQTYGVGWLMSNRETVDLAPLPASGRRAERAHANLKENYSAFVAAVLLATLGGHAGTGAAVASAVFVGARRVHLLAYVGGVFWPRTIAWALGWASTVYLLATAVLH